MVTIKVSDKAHKRLIENKEKTGAPYTFVIDRALDLYLGKQNENSPTHHIVIGKPKR